ncbi:MAG TPA: ABC transporter ATP-binding protein [Terriglobales bacterium]|nr:ABC transporter ATP-binding protein [Terriglobales bacterium]
MNAIEIFGLEKTYLVGFWHKRPRVGLRPLTLSVPAGEIFGYLGPNGAGKTTTLRLLMGLITPSGGSFRILGGDIRDPKIRSQIGFLPEQPYFYDYLTGRELLDYYGQLSGTSASDRKRRIDATLNRVGIADAADVQLRKYSKGMLQRVGIAQAILHDPPLVFLDEPMSGLDPLGRHEVRELIQQLKDEGKTVFFSTHILSDAEALCDRVAILGKGELRGVGVVAELTARISDNVEVIWHGSAAVPAMRALAIEVHLTGDTARATVPQSKVDAAIDAIRRSQARLTSINPIRTTLEDYFIERLAEGVEVTR